VCASLADLVARWPRPKAHEWGVAVRRPNGASWHPANEHTIEETYLLELARLRIHGAALKSDDCDEAVVERVERGIVVDSQRVPVRRLVL
jgi:hypothetical protein